MRSFLNAWAQKYDSTKYSREFYFDSIQAIKKSDNPAELSKLIIGMLHWKDGKVWENHSGNFRLNSSSYHLETPKPNTYNVDKHNKILSSYEFFRWSRSIIECEEFDEKQILALTGQFNLWSSRSIVLSAFVLHTLSPFIYPIYDQHVERAKRALLAKDLNMDSSGLGVEEYKSYKYFFNNIIDELYEDKNIIALQGMKLIDEGLWSFGKWLKSVNRSSNIRDIGKSSLIKIEVRYTPDDSFKSEAMELVNNGMTHYQAIKSTAEKHGVMLPDSYYKYPGSHIYRWKQQGF